MSLNTRLLLGTLVAVIIMPFLDLRQLCTLALLTAIILILVGGYKLLKEIRAFYIAILGFGVMAFLDIWKYNFFFNTRYRWEDNYDWAAYWTYIAFAIFLIVYRFKTWKFKLPRVEISNTRMNFIAIPISLIVLVYYVSLVSGVDVHSTQHSVFHLISFFPKACTVLLFYLFVHQRKPIYLIWFLVFLGMSFTEGTRRVYIAMFLSCFTVLYAFILEREGRIHGRYKALLMFSFIGIFFYMNFLRADQENVKGFDEGNTLGNTLNYMVQLKALDTYDNTAFILTHFPEEYDYYCGETYVALFVQFIPRIFWEQKPVGLGGPLGLMRTAGLGNFTKQKWITRGKGISLSPGFVGEAYANFGTIGILLMSALFGWATKLFDTNINPGEVLRNPVQLAYTSWYGAFFLVLRGDLVAALYYSLLFFIFIMLWLLVLRK